MRETSREAAQSVSEDDRSELRQKILRHIKRAGQKGMTDEEIQYATGIQGNTERPRRLELAERKLIQASDLRRQTSAGRKATVWIACE